MKVSLSLIILTISIACNAQTRFDHGTISHKTAELISAIEKVNVLKGPVIGDGGERPMQYENFELLEKAATQKELITLTDHPNPTVRCYAFWALNNRGDVKLLPIVLKHFNDTAIVKMHFGCIGSYNKVGDYFVESIRPVYRRDDTLRLKPEEYAYLDSMLLFTPNELFSIRRAILTAPMNEKTYNRVREVVVNENNQDALEKLASFKRVADIPLIFSHKRKRDNGSEVCLNYYAISEFPHPDFLPELNSAVKSAVGKDRLASEWKGLYNAIASYKNDASLKLLKIPFTKSMDEDIRKYHINFVFDAVSTHYTPYYNDLLWDIWENEKRISTAMFEKLYPENPARGLSLIKKTLRNLDDFYYLSTGGYAGYEAASVGLLPVMMDTLLAYDRPAALDLINKNIRTVNVHSFLEVADKAGQINDTSLVESFFARLETETNPHIYLKTVEVLIAIGDPSINKRIKEAPGRNPNLKKDWGGKAFDKLLKENSID
ncbi:hypothetical protein [Chitinophaga deserti]|uniref:hypothetical protein n=1 Tax=Chitinophaga deserti TaxID=2164099 RepID=UPI000D6CA0B5|nr:hypothetical protein [Chitinophaga deserti]